MNTPMYAALACLLAALVCLLKTAESAPKECDDCNTTNKKCGGGLSCQKVGLGEVSRCRCLRNNKEFAWAESMKKNVDCWKELEGPQLSVHNGGDQCTETNVKALPPNSPDYNWDEAKKKVEKKMVHPDVVAPNLASSKECDDCTNIAAAGKTPCKQSLNPFAITLTCQKLGNGATSKCRCVDGTHGWAESLKNPACLEGLSKNANEIQNHGDHC